MEIKNVELLKLDLTEFENWSLDDLKEQLPDILDEQNQDEPMYEENWGIEYYFQMNNKLYSFYVADSGKSDDPGCNYGEIAELVEVKLR